MNATRDLLRALSVTPEEHVRRALFKAWEDGYTACAAEFEHQRKNPDYTVGRENPHATGREHDADTLADRMDAFNDAMRKATSWDE